MIYVTNTDTSLSVYSTVSMLESNTYLLLLLHVMTNPLQCTMRSFNRSSRVNLVWPGMKAPSHSSKLRTILVHSSPPPYLSSPNRTNQASSESYRISHHHTQAIKVSAPLMRTSPPHISPAPGALSTPSATPYTICHQDHKRQSVI